MWRAAEQAARAWDMGMLVRCSADMFPSHALGNLNYPFLGYLQGSDGQVRLLGSSKLAVCWGWHGRHGHGGQRHSRAAASALMSTLTKVVTKRRLSPTVTCDSAGAGLMTSMAS